MDAYAKKVEVTAEEAARTAFISIAATVVPATPVDTGHARNNWLSSIDVDPAGATNPADKSGAGAIAQATNTGLAYTNGRTAILVNNVPYIRRLNAGHSKQAPIGFFERAVNAGAKAAAKILRNRLKEK